jgi:hypothetical protein
LIFLLLRTLQLNTKIIFLTMIGFWIQELTC